MAGLEVDVMQKSKRKTLTAGLTMLVVGGVVCCAGPITYAVDQTGIGFDQGSVTGTIQTDGTIGTLATSDILSWNLVLSNGLGSSFDSTNGNSTASVTGDGLTATATELLFNYGSGGVFEIVDSPNLWELGFTSGPVFEEILPLGLDGNAVPEAGTQVIGTAVPEPSTYMLTLMGGLVLLRKRVVSVGR